MDQFLNVPFVRAFLKMLANFSDFQSRTSREDYWWAVLGSFILGLVVGVVCGLLGTLGSILSGLISLVLLVPGLANSVRRLHDINKSGFWLLIGLVPLVGGIILLIFMIKEGDADANTYGPNPKYLG